MLAAVHIDDPVRAGVSCLVQLVDVRQALRRVGHRELPRVGIDARHTHRQARCVRLVFRQPLVLQLARPREQRQFAGLQAAVPLDVAIRSAAEPRPGEVDRAVRQAWDRLAVDVLVGDDGVPQVRCASPAPGLRSAPVSPGLEEQFAHVSSCHS